MTHAGWIVAVLATVTTLGCGGSLRPAMLIASARAAYPDCDDLRIGERDEGVRQWIVVCGEPRLFGLPSQQTIARDPDDERLSDDSRLAVLEDQSPPIQWRAPRRVDDASVSSLAAWLQPLRVEVTLLGVGTESSYLTVEAPHHESCTTAPALHVADQPRAMDSAPTETRRQARDHFAQRIDLSTLRLIASSVIEISYCGERHALDYETADAFRTWAAERARSSDTVVAE